MAKVGDGEEKKEQTKAATEIEKATLYNESSTKSE